MTAVVTGVVLDGVTLYDAANPNAVLIPTSDTVRSLLRSAKPREEMESRVDDDGGTDVTQFYEPRVFDPFAGKIRAPDAETFMAKHNQLAALFTLGSYHLLSWTLGDGSSRQVFVRAASEWECEPLGSSSHAVWSVVLVAPNPLLVSSSLKSATLDPFESQVSGLTFPLSFPLDFAGVSDSTISVTNSGTRTARPVYTFEGPWSNPFVENASTGVRFYTAGLELAAGETVVVDTAARVVTYQGVDTEGAFVDWQLSSWPLIPVGVNLIRAGGSPGPDSLMSVQFRDTYV